MNLPLPHEISTHLPHSAQLPLCLIHAPAAPQVMVGEPVLPPLHAPLHTYPTGLPAQLMSQSTLVEVGTVVQAVCVEKAQCHGRGQRGKEEEEKGKQENGLEGNRCRTLRDDRYFSCEWQRRQADQRGEG